MSNSYESFFIVSEIQRVIGYETMTDDQIVNSMRTFNEYLPESNIRRGINQMLKIVTKPVEVLSESLT